ncbi:hypothetical protein GH714_010399 [Hevea brasiliensis]|uniref:Uncharacterized protein n=1 Tax=Hevea brasiliensis TaxID=3981 RepID=A0A6A6N259_HEVBR|nr:hypothetical protein GH714_010399 [Hevea brasiliensis]
MPKKKREITIVIPLPQKMMKVENSPGNTGNRVFGGISAQKQTPGRIIGRKRRLRAKEKTEALRRASTNFKSENPFFLIAMQPSYVHPGEKMTIPASFSVKYFPMKHSGDATLNGLDGRTWPVKFYICNKHELKDEERYSPGAIEAAKSFTSVHPFFKSVISPGHMENHNMVGSIDENQFLFCPHHYSIENSTSVQHVPQKFISNIKQSTGK